MTKPGKQVHSSRKGFHGVTEKLLERLQAQAKVAEEHSYLQNVDVNHVLPVFGG